MSDAQPTDHQETQDTMAAATATASTDQEENTTSAATQEEENVNVPVVKDSKPFRFFDLPPELREMVYDLLGSDEVAIASPELEANLSIQDSPITSVLLVNREMSGEYRKVAAKNTKLVFSDHENFNFTLLPIPTKVWATTITRIAVRNFVVCEDKCPKYRENCEAASDLQQTVEFIEKINTQVPGKSLEVNLGLWCKDGEKCAWPELPHREDVVKTLYNLTESVSNLSQVNVYRSPQRCLEPEKLESQDRLLASWTKKGVWQA